MENNQQPTLHVSQLPVNNELNSKKPKNIYLTTILIIFTVILISLVTAIIIRSNSSENKPSSSSATASVPVMANITPTGFSPNTITINRGQSVVWTNYDSKNHNIEAEVTQKNSALSGFNSPVLGDGQTFSFVFNQKGTFAYQDTLNPLASKAVVIVK